MAFLASGCLTHIPDEMVQEISKLTDKIDYNFHVKPILSDKCFACHGPDAKNRKANLRLDFNQKLLKDKDPQVLTFDDVKSKIPNRLLSLDPNIKMPPPESHLNLSDREIATILKPTVQQRDSRRSSNGAVRFFELRQIELRLTSGWSKNVTKARTQVQE